MRVPAVLHWMSVTRIAKRALAMRFATGGLATLLAASLATLGGCRSANKDAVATDSVASAPEVAPPFAVRDGVEGLYLVWYDAEGAAHTATRIEDVPPANRIRVRVDSLALAPEKRLDPAFVYVADLAKARADGSYAVRQVARELFEASVLPASKDADNSGASPVTSASKDIVLYGASWCGACKQARNFFTQKGLPFVEKDIEREPDARSEMLAKARAQGVSTAGIPVIDVRGVLMGGFDPRRIESALSAN